MHLAFVWHFHQPVYRDPEHRTYLLPWVYYHGLKNYHQMALLLEELGARWTFKYVPCLLEQLAEYAEGLADDPVRQALTKLPARLSVPELDLLRPFAPGETEPPRIQDKALRFFFSPLSGPGDDREMLLEREKEILAGLVPRYARLVADGKAELTTSPYYHPLLPLIFDIRATDQEPRPALPFRYPEDGRTQILEGREYFKRVFGAVPRGMWPSEGGLSREVAAAVAQSGFLFALTDESLLWKSLPAGPHDRRRLYRPYLCEGLAVFFRDRELSDLIGFEYQHWRADEAACHFVARLEERARVAGEDGLCAVVLDGENPWGYYPENGVPFLRELFRRLASVPGLRPTFLGDYLDQHPPEQELTLVPGTWLGSFAQWTGHPAKNAAWDLLARARKRCGFSAEIAVAEGSDWFWWYGEKDKAVFDTLFRAYVRAAYAKAGLTESR